MNNPRSNNEQDRTRRALPYFVEFVKFSAAFAALIAVALLTLHVASAAMN
ncbi:hypothetical protein KGQ72_02200 [Patescibacteria group bacterium]|nr:hypothetical protein [Patescibacteria group bacterium]